MKLKILFLAAVLAFSGCLDLPSGTGNTVIAEITVFDADTGALLTEATAYQFVLGQDNVGFGLDFEQKLERVKENDHLSILDKGPEFEGSINLPAVFGPGPLVNQLGQEMFEANLGVMSVGEEFQPANSFYGYRVEAIADGFVTFRALPQDGQRNFLPELGADLVIKLNGDDTMTQYLEPVVGSIFEVTPNPQDGSTLLGLETGSYLVTGGSLGELTLGYTPAKSNVVGKNLRYEVDILAVLSGAVEAEVVDGNYGVRPSPVLNGPFDPTQVHDHDETDDHTH